MATVPMIAASRVKASNLEAREPGCSGERCYFRLLLFFAAGFFFFPADLALAFAAFLGDFFTALPAAFFFDDELLPLEKMFSQFSEYCLVAPMRTTLIVTVGP